MSKNERSRNKPKDEQDLEINQGSPQVPVGGPKPSGQGLVEPTGEPVVQDKPVSPEAETREQNQPDTPPHPEA